MSRTATALDAPLIDDVEFLAELERQERGGPAPAPAEFDAFDALEAGLPVARNAVPAPVPYLRRPPIAEPFVPAEEEPEPAAPVAPGVSLRAAALVILLCLGTGAATAAVVFHDSLSRISALVTASR